MTALPKDTVERIYAGWYGKLIGIRHGSNIEGWTAEQIAARYGEITGYLFDFKNFAADDDSNGPVFFIRVLDDYGLNPTDEQLGLTLLNYAPYEHGFFWWGGYGVSTEHTAYLNLANGIPAPRSGSVELNGAAVAEQIGGQIFIDVWGLVNPGNYRRAAGYARRMAGVTHGGNGVYGGMFVAACVSAAFTDNDLGRILEKALSVIPEDCEYRRMADDIRRFHREHPASWRDCFRFVRENYGYDRYPGACHIIPNSAVVLLSLLYGEGDFSRAVNICNMCGWDTDCNVANVGCIMGVLTGLAGVDYEKWRKPINDFLACSSTLGCLNLRDVANDALHFSALAYRLAGEEFPARYRPMMEGSAPRYHFELPDSTHAFRADSGVRLENSGEAAYTGTRSLKITSDHGGTAEQPVHVTQLAYYLAEDFSDDRYTPTFTPTVFPGQSLRAFVKVAPGSPKGLSAALYAEKLYGDPALSGKSLPLSEDAWTELTLTIPGRTDEGIRSVGVAFQGTAGPFTAYLDSLEVSGKAAYTLNFQKTGVEQWPTHRQISQCTPFKGSWYLADGLLHGSCADRGEIYTGDCEWTDYTFETTITPLSGPEHYILVRVQGATRCYAAGFDAGGKLVLWKNENGCRELVSCSFEWETEKTYPLSVAVHGGEITVSCGGCQLRFCDRENPYLNGAVGAGVSHGSHCRFDAFHIH